MLEVIDEGGYVDAATGQEALDPPRREPEGPLREPAEARSPRGRRTRAALVVAGRAVFERDGFIEARITDIAAGAGVSHGTFYTYFAGKEEIFREIVSGVQIEMRAHGPGMPPDDDLWGRIEHGNRVYIETYLRNQKIMATLEQVVTFNEEVVRCAGTSAAPSWSATSEPSDGGRRRAWPTRLSTPGTRPVPWGRWSTASCTPGRCSGSRSTRIGPSPP
jgi:AcrR family transcriptional regulator